MFEVGKKYKAYIFPDKIYTCKAIGDTFVFLESDKRSYWCVGINDVEHGLEEVREPRVIYVNEWKTGWGSVYASKAEGEFYKDYPKYVSTRKFIEVLD